MNRALALSVLISLLAIPLAADAPETGLLSGRVVDSTGAALPGVIITLLSEWGTVEQTTDGEGRYRFALLQPGRYTVSAAIEGFRSASAQADVIAGKKAEIDLRLVLATAEEITVVSEAPMVDKYNVTVGGTVQAETVIEAAPVNRGIYGPINFLPGVTNDVESLDLSSSRPTVNGTSWIESAVFIDGVDTTFTRYGSTRMFLPTTATTEISLESGGQSAEYGRVVGSHVNIISRSGTNQWHGEANWIHQDLSIDRNYKPQPVLEQKLSNRVPADFVRYSDSERDSRSDDTLELGLGGPIVRDRAWFFVSAADWTTFYLDKTQNGDPINNSTETESYMAKVNLQPSSRHGLAVSWISTPIDRLFHLPVMADRYVPTLHDLGGRLVTGSWNYSLSPDLFLETKLASHTSSEDKLLNAGTGFDLDSALAEKRLDPRFAPVPGLSTPDAPVNNYHVYLDTAPGGSWNNGWLLDNGIGTNEYPRDQANAAVTYFATPQHELRFGADWQETEWEQDVFHNDIYFGNRFRADSPSGFAPVLPGPDGRLGTGDDVVNCGIPGLLPGPTCTKLHYNPADVVAAGKGTGRSVSEARALYVNDRMTLGNHWTLSAGLRFEDQEHQNDIGRTVIDSSDLSPRVTAVYDIAADGKMLVSGSAARLYTHVPQETINTYLLDEWNGFNAQDFLLYNRISRTYSIPIGRVRPGQFWDFVDSGLIPDPDIDPYYKDELVLGYEWQFKPVWAFSAKGIWWETGDQWGSTQQRGPNGEIFFLTANLEDYPSILRQLGFVNNVIANGGTAALAEQILADFRDGYREYRGLQLQVNRRHSNGWSWYNNVTLADADGNTQGDSFFNNTNDEYGRNLDVFLTRAHIDQCAVHNAGTRFKADCAALASHLGRPLSTINQEGPLAVDRDLIVKSYGFKTWKVGQHDFNVGGFFNYAAGAVWSRTMTVTPPTGGSSGAISLVDTIALNLEPENRRQLDDYWWVNLSGAWNFPIYSELRGQLRLEAINVTDEQDLLSVDGTGEPRNSRREFQRPTQYRFMIGLRF